MIVITNPSSIANEISIIDSLFEEGLSLLHIRKPDFSELEMALFIHQIKLRFRANLVLHSHHELAQDFGINRIHFPEKQRKEVFEIARENKIISTSVHSIETFNALHPNFEYAFLSPVFKSISKENYELPHRVGIRESRNACGGYNCSTGNYSSISPVFSKNNFWCKNQ